MLEKIRNAGLISTLVGSLLFPVKGNTQTPPKDNITPVVQVSQKKVKKEDTLEKKVSGVRIKSIHIVSKKEGEKYADTRHEFAKRGEKVELYAVVKAQTPRGTKFYSDAKHVKLGSRKISPKRLSKWNHLRDLVLKWSKVELDSEGKYYDNKKEVCNRPKCHIIDYKDVFFKKGWKIEADAHPTLIADQFADDRTGVGVMRYKLSVVYGGKEISTSGAELLSENKRLGDRKIAKVVFRNNEGNPTDYTFELFNTPYIWGSWQFDVDHQIGSDCADLVAYSRRRMGFKQPYTWSQGLINFTNLVVNAGSIGGEKFFRGEDGKPIKFGQTVRQGDVLVFSRHASVLYKDNGNGILDKDDTMIHTLFDQPGITPINYRSHFQVRRWRTGKK